MQLYGTVTRRRASAFPNHAQSATKIPRGLANHDLNTDVTGPGVVAHPPTSYVLTDTRTGDFMRIPTKPSPVFDAATDPAGSGKDLGNLPDWDLSDLYAAPTRRK